MATWIVFGVLTASQTVLGRASETCEAKGSVLLQQQKQMASVRNGTLSQIDSLGFFDEDDAVWKARKEIHHAWMKKQLDASSEFDLHAQKVQAPVFWQDHFEPTFHCDLAERIGNVGDGGKWICNPASIRQQVKEGGSCLVYSVGSNGQFDFEVGVVHDISPDCEIHIFDPSPPGTVAERYYADRGDHIPKQATYHQLAIGVDGADLGLGVPTKSISTIVKELGHEGRWIDIFKIDCEGCEWDVFNDFSKDGVMVRQIQAELHLKTRVPKSQHEFRQKVEPLFTSLFNAGFVVFNKEANIIAGGYPVEFSFLKLNPSF
eukprot:TRINITY_DN47653_c0_g1_i1.p1 TRINITY_DN47653_c0_g1~~TRINITY_DN47653_c0_g1_i1.p1  ORF type:complete len:318 (-),score=61.03 TRINITY_DN47653_c0_g1_i1:34-987(-)